MSASGQQISGPKRIGFVGLGSLGARLVERLVRSSFEWVRVFDVDRDKLTRFEGRAELAGSLAEAADGAQIVGVCVQNDAQLRDVVAGDRGLLSLPSAKDLLIAVHSTVHPETCRDLARRAAANGATLIDAAISNGGAGMDVGHRVVVVGASDSVFEWCRPYLDSMAEVVEHAGEVGAAEVIKLLNNLLMTANLGLAAETIRLGAQLGVQPDVLVRTLLNGSGTSQGAFTLQKSERAAHNEVLLSKDVHLASEVLKAGELGAETLLTAGEIGLHALRDVAASTSANA